MPIALTNLTAEIQARCNALTTFSTVNAVIDCAVAAKKLEMAGGSINRTILDTELQRVITASGNGSLIEDLIALAASVEQRATNGKTRKTQAFTTSGTWTKPAGVDSIEILLVGGGGGAGAGSSSGSSTTLRISTGAGGGGQVIKRDLDVSSIASGTNVPVVIGAGGIGGASANAAGAVGGDSTFGTLLTALGGGSGGGVAYGGTTAGTPRATTGGSGAYVTHGSYSVVILPALGGGAGGHAKKGNYSNSSNGSYAGTTFSTQSHNIDTSVPCGVGTTFAGNSSDISYSAFSLNNVCEPGPSLHGYGAGGGYTGSYNPVPGLDGAGGFNSKHAAANSGGGGASVDGGTGGNGGSGYCLITWWE